MTDPSHYQSLGPGTMVQTPFGPIHVALTNTSERQNDMQVQLTGRIPLIAPLPWKAARGIDRRLSFAGSGLPFATEEMAMQGGPQGLLPTGRPIQLRIRTPNSYYVQNGHVLLPPSIMLGSFRLVLPPEAQVPDRSLTHLPGRPIRSTPR
jgi:hypothetical protein